MPQAEHGAEAVGEARADPTANETAGKQANHIENALISQTPLQLMFGGFTLVYPCS
jgi:hypothetical protein